MPTTFKVVCIATVIGLVAVSCNDHEKVFESNCQKIHSGMTIQQAIKAMNEGLHVDYETYKMGLDLNDSIPKDFYITYPIDGGSFLVTIHFDKNTGLVTSVDRPDEERFKNR